MSFETMVVPGLGPVPVNPTEREARSLLARGHSYVATVDLTASGISSNNGTEQIYAGYGLYLMHQSPPNAVLEVRFDQVFGRSVVFRRGTLHHLGPVLQQTSKSPAYFTKFWAKVVQGGDTTGTAYFLVLGTPETIYLEDPRSVAYVPVATAVNVGAAIATVLTAANVQTVANLRVFVGNGGGTALVSAPLEVSPDGSSWEQILMGAFDLLQPSTTLSAGLPAGIKQVRMRAATASSSTAVTVWLLGTMA